MKFCSVRNGSSVNTAVNERGEGTVVAVYSDVYERTFVAVLHFHFMTACYDCIPQTPEKKTVFSFYEQSQVPK